MDINKKNRSDLKSYFVKNSIPTESNFSDLIDGMLNQKDDGIVKLSGDPLSIEAAGDSTGLQKVINFYTKLQNANPDWSLQLNPRTDSSTESKAGLCIADGLSTPRLFIDKNTGNVGIATITPNAKLDVNGNLAVTGNVASTGTLVVTGAITPSAGNTETKGIMFPKDPFGGGGDAAWIRYYARSGEACTLEIGIANDADDHIALMPNAGNVGIGTNTPKAKLDINGNLAVAGVTALSSTLAVTGATTLSGALNVTAATTLSGSLTVNNAFYAGNSDLYFTKTDHTHTGFGNTEGYAAIENAKDCSALMILGRSVNKLRTVKLWDYLQVNGNMDVTGVVALSQTLAVTGAATLASNLTVNGNIGIGTITPGAKLDVEGGAFLGYETSLSNFGVLLKSGFYQGVDPIVGDVPDTTHPWTHLITSRHSNVENNHQLQIAATFASNDKLYFRKIAATLAEADNPVWNELATRGANVFSGNQLVVNGAITPSAGNTETNGIMFPKDPFGGGGDAAWIRYYARSGEACTLEIGIANDADDHIALMPSGNVGIGTTTPTQAKLVVMGTASSTLNGYGYTNRNGASATNTNTTANYSIFANDRIAASEFNAFSDERIKISLGRSDNATDLQTLLGIEITDYHYKDVIGKGDAPHKKVIAQQVEQVFPQAVSKHTDVVPDIYQLAAVVDGWVELATDLQPGERVRLICDKVEGLYDVLEVTKDKFRADFKPDGDKIFVFGREVNDFCNVDYDAIAMLNVSATQQLKKEMDALKVENADLNARLAALEAKI